MRGEQHMSRSEKPSCKTLYLDSSHRNVTISPEGYQKILELLKEIKACKECVNYYSPENPNVAGNMCLQCFSAKHASLTFVGLLDPTASTEPAANPKYLFLSKKDGHAYTSTAGPGVTDSASEDKELTLRYWQFPQPTEGVWNGETVKLGEYVWFIYGDVRTDDIIMIQKKEKFFFFVKRGGPAIQLSKRKEMHRSMLAEARAQLEATRRADGNYYFHGEIHYVIHDGDVYRQIIQLVNAERDALHSSATDEQPAASLMTTPAAAEPATTEHNEAMERKQPQ
jgi:hypothetical protein